MSDDEIRDLLDLGVQEPAGGDALSAEQLWSAGRRQRNRGRAWLGGLGAAAAAASLLGIVWAQGLAGGDAAPPPSDETPDTMPSPSPTVDGGEDARGEPFFARFESADSEPAAQLSGASRPATLEDLQGTWHGPFGELFGFDGDTFTVDTGAPCHEGGSQQVEVSPEGRLLVADGIAWEQVDCSADDEGRVGWRYALQQEPLLSMDGGTLIISGLDGTSDDPRVPVALTLASSEPFDSPSVWRDTSAQTGVSPIELGEDVELTIVGTTQDAALSGQEGSGVFVSGIGALTVGQQDGCSLGLTTSLRSDGVLLAGDARPLPECSTGAQALPAVAPSEAVLHLLRSGPTFGVEGATMVISGTIPESLLTPTEPPVESADPTEDETGAETPTQPDDIPLVVGTPRVIVMSEGEWAPTAELTPLTEEAATGRRWLPVTTESDPPEVGADPNGDRGLSFDGTTWSIRDCGIDIRVRGGVQDGLLTTAGEPEVMPDPDPGAACVFPLTPEEWEAILTSEPWLSTDGEILVIAAGADDTRLEPVGMAFLADGDDDPQGGPTAPVTLEDLAAGLVEVSGDVAVQDVGVSDVRDPQPGHATRLSVEDGVVSIDVGCAEPLRGPAWFSHVGPEDTAWQLTAALPTEPDCAGAAADDAELWRQLLAHGAFLHRFGDYVIVDVWADPELAPTVEP